MVNENQLAPVTISDGVAEIVSNRPARKNALTGPLVDALRESFDAAVAHADVNAILFRGEGGAFCSGLDLDEFRADPPRDWLPEFPAKWAAFHLAMYRSPKPIVCALERYAINGGSSFALAADFLVMGESAFLQVGEVRMGMAAPMNLAWLQLRGGRQLLTELAVLGRRMDAAWMERRGLAHRVVPDADVAGAAREVAQELAALPAATVAHMKSEIRRFEGGGVSPEALFAPRRA